MNFKKTRSTILATLAFVTVFSVGYTLGLTGVLIDAKGFPKVTISRELPENKKLDFELFWKTWDAVEASYVDKSKLIPSQMVYGAIKGMVSSLGDPYTVFLTPSENKVTEEDLKGNFDGVGIQIGYRGNQLSVIAPLPNTPAEKAGVLAGDYILQIKDEKKNIDRDTAGMSLPEAVQIIRGVKGTKVSLTMLRDGDTKPRIFDLERATIDVPSVVLSNVGENGDIAHIKLLKFGADTRQEWNKSISEAIAKGSFKKIIVDLRNNPGGYMQSAIDILGDFLPQNSVAVIEERSDKSRTEYKTTTASKLEDSKIVVLVNKGSASASEILAGALRDQRKIKIVGDTSFGKGTIQEPQTLDNGAGLHVTIAKWLTPNGTWVHGQGLEPDIKVDQDTETIEDEQLNEAIKLINSL